MSGSEISCREVLDFLAAYLDGELPEGTRSDLEHHLARCPECVEYLTSYREAVRLGRLAHRGDDPVPGVPEALVEAILAGRRSA